MFILLLSRFDELKKTVRLSGVVDRSCDFFEVEVEKWEVKSTRFRWVSLSTAQLLLANLDALFVALRTLEYKKTTSLKLLPAGRRWPDFDWFRETEVKSRLAQSESTSQLLA